jgi:DNA-binding response OmpR family regulator
MNADGVLRVLVADDDTSLLDLMTRRLSKMGITPDRASDGAIAQELIEKNDYDVIITDIYMPEVTGLELLHIAKERDPNVQVVVATASATIDNAVDALNNGAFGYLTKPFDHLSVFDKIVTRAMEFRQLLLDNERMAEVQKRRGDMLEEEVTQRIRQLRDRQRDLINLLASLPLGVTVVEEGGRIIMSNPQADQWLNEEKRARGRPIQEFMNSVHEDDSEPSVEVVIGGHTVRLTAVDILHGTPKKQKVVIIGEIQKEEEDISQGTMVEDAIGRLHEGLVWLAGQAMGGKANDVTRSLVREIVGLGRMMGLEIEDPVLPEFESPLPEEAVFDEPFEAAQPVAEDDEEMDERLLAALQGSPKPEPAPAAKPEPPPRRQAPVARQPAVAPAIESGLGRPTRPPRKPEADTEAERPIMKPEKPALERPAPEARPRVASEGERAVFKPPVPEEARPREDAREPMRVMPDQERVVAKQPTPQEQRPAFNPPVAEEAGPREDAREPTRAMPEQERPVTKLPTPQEQRPPVIEPRPTPREEKKAPAFKSRLLQKAKELESGGWRPGMPTPAKSGANGDSHAGADEAPDDSVLSRLAQVTEDSAKPKRPSKSDVPEPPRRPARPEPEPVLEEDEPRWAEYVESDTGSAGPKRGKGVWPPPLPSAFDDVEEEPPSEA